MRKILRFNLSKLFKQNKMRLILQILVTAFLGLILAQFMPWWSVAIAAAAAGYFFKGHRGKSFLAGFLGIFLLWFLAALYIKISTGSDFPDRFAMLFPFPLSGTALMAVSGVIGGLVGGFGAFTGDSLQRMFDKKA